MPQSIRPHVLASTVLILTVWMLVQWFSGGRAEAPTEGGEALVVTAAPSARAQCAVVASTPDEWVVASATAMAPEPESVPELAGSDRMVRRLAAGLSASPQLTSWMVTDGLIRRFVAATHAIAGGYSPREEVSFLRPTGAFLVQHREQGLVIAPSSFRRYDAVAEVFASLDNDGLLRLYEELKPLIDEAYRELPWIRGEFGDVLLEAMDHLLATPVPDDLPAVERGTVYWLYADDSIEQLSDAQRHLVRMGPRNARIIQAKLAQLHRVFAPDEPLNWPNPLDRGGRPQPENAVSARTVTQTADERAIVTIP